MCASFVALQAIYLQSADVLAYFAEPDWTMMAQLPSIAAVSMSTRARMTVTSKGGKERVLPVVSVSGNVVCSLASSTH